MRVVHGIDDAPRAAVRTDGAVVTIGAYDGVHLGHQAVLRLVRELAEARGLEAALVTFDRHPAEVVRPESAPRLLTTLEQRLELLEATGSLDLCWVLTFDEERSKESAEDFVREVLVDGIGARLVVVGADFHFGHRRGGNVPLLERMGADLRARLGERLREHGVDGHITGDASLFRFVMTSKPPRTYRDTVEPAASERMGRLFMHLLDAGVLVNTNGLACLSTPMGDAELAEIVQAFDQALWQLRRAR